MAEQMLLFPEMREEPAAAAARVARMSRAPRAVLWNLWHGCDKFSEGCLNCYVFRNDAKIGKDSTLLHKTRDFDLPARRNKNGSFRFPGGSFFWTCFSSDFLHRRCDEWRGEAWAFMRERSDCRFLFLTKRIERFEECLPPDWGAGFENVTVGCTCENQRQTDLRLPIFRRCPIRHKIIIHEPLLSAVDIAPWLDATIEEVAAGGESGATARACRHEWFVSLRDQCAAANVTFRFRQTGAVFIKDGKTYHIPRRLQHAQATKAALDFTRRR
jgi:protein gp37